MAVTINVKEIQADSPTCRYFEFKIDPHTVYTTVRSNHLVVNDWINTVYSDPYSRNHIRDKRLVVGLSIQWKPKPRTPQQSSTHPAATIQLCVKGHCLIYHICHATHRSYQLNHFFHEPRITFVGFQNKNHIWKLGDSVHNLTLQSGMPIDLDKCIYPQYGSSLQSVAETFLGVQISWDKKVIFSDWEVEQLSLKQISHAFVTAYVPLAIGLCIKAWELNPHYRVS